MNHKTFSACSRAVSCPASGFRKEMGAHLRPLLFSLLVAVLCLASAKSQAVIRFDVFFGYDGIVPEACWFPLVCEISNDGAPFTAVVELSPGNYNQGQTRRAVVELPTGTLKRLVIPVFSTTRGFSSWDVRLFDEHGKVRSEQLGVRPRKQLASGATVLGSLPRTASGNPVMQNIQAQQQDLQPSSARMLPALFPDNPLVLEGMDTLYLNSEKAAELKSGQVTALFSWLNAGGHLIVAVEQPSDISASPWLSSLFPCEVTGLEPLKNHPQFENWVKSPGWPSGSHNLGSTPNYYGNNANNNPERMAIEASNPFGDAKPDYTFATGVVQVATATVKDGQVILDANKTPLIVSALRGRGAITALLFSPEREPFRSWQNLPRFWARVAEVPGILYLSGNNIQSGGFSSDGIFGAMIDTKQIHKLPVEWLMLLLVVYLIVIGPLDRFWLKKINRPMLTWITFPCYVVFFSLLIYFIGYKLRSGESEWNELHLVDVLANGERAEMRGRTYISLYSPSNQRYLLESRQKFSTLRGEFIGSFGGGQSSEKGAVMQNGDSFKAEVFVPVWTSELLVNDWWQSAQMPLLVTVTPDEDQWQVKVENTTDRRLANLQLAVAELIIPLGDLGAKETKTFPVSREKGLPVKDFVVRHGQNFQNAAQSRQRSFGDTDSGRLADLPNNCIAASFLSQAGPEQGGFRFLAPPGLDMSPYLSHGGAVLFAWAEDYSAIEPIRQFSVRRNHKATLWRVPIKMPPAKI